MKIDRFTSPLPYMPRLSSPRPRLGHGRRHAHLSPQSDTKFVYMYSLRSVASSPSSPFSSPNFPNCSCPWESASVFANYLRCHFFVFQPKALRSRATDYLSELCRATCPEESHSSFCYPFSATEFLAAATNLSLPTATGPNKVAYSMLMHLPRSGMNFLQRIFNFSQSLHSFSSI